MKKTYTQWLRKRKQKHTQTLQCNKSTQRIWWFKPRILFQRHNSYYTRDIICLLKTRVKREIERDSVSISISTLWLTHTEECIEEKFSLKWYSNVSFLKNVSKANLAIKKGYKRTSNSFRLTHYRLHLSLHKKEHSNRQLCLFSLEWTSIRLISFTTGITVTFSERDCISSEWRVSLWDLLSWHEKERERERERLSCHELFSRECHADVVQVLIMDLSFLEFWFIHYTICLNYSLVDKY
jgi:hypothetical protein